PALLGAGADQLVGVHRHRRVVSLPRRRHQSARPRGDARHSVGRAGDQPGAEGVQWLGDLSVLALSEHFHQQRTYNDAACKCGGIIDDLANPSIPPGSLLSDEFSAVLLETTENSFK